MAQVQDIGILSRRWTVFDSGCCGGGIARTHQIRSIQAVNEKEVRLEFLGVEPGNDLYEGPSGRKYRAGSNYLNRWIDVLESDVPTLLALKDDKGQPLFKQLFLAEPAPVAEPTKRSKEKSE